jgi:hypothetical protein
MSESGIAGLAGVVGIGFAVWLWNPQLPWSDEGVAYPALCDVTPETLARRGADYCPVRTLNPHFFRVDRANNEVVRWADESPINPGLSKLHRCIIKDTRTWKCWYSDGSGPVLMVDGIENFQPVAGFGRVVFLRRWQWHVATWWSALTKDGFDFGWLLPAQPKA